MSAPTVMIRVDGRTVRAAAGVTVAVALAQEGLWTFRHSIAGQPRGPVCGMGVCYECRVSIGGVPHRRACLQRVEPGMEITTVE